ncbi:hypothetical protein SRHO_G00266520 [Serrasalmus rhombeus]
MMLDSSMLRKTGQPASILLCLGGNKMEVPPRGCGQTDGEREDVGCDLKGAEHNERRKREGQRLGELLLARESYMQAFSSGAQMPSQREAKSSVTASDELVWVCVCTALGVAGAEDGFQGQGFRVSLTIRPLRWAGVRGGLWSQSDAPDRSPSHHTAAGGACDPTSPHESTQRRSLITDHSALKRIPENPVNQQTAVAGLPPPL